MTPDDDLDRLAAQFLQAVEQGLNPNPAEWLARHPEHAAGLAAFFADVGRFGSFLGLPSRSHMDETVDHLGAGDAAPERSRFGDYELLSEIGRGAMGTVHRARLKGTNLVVALKQVSPGGLDKAATARRFRGEVESASGLRHPHIVPIYHVGEHGGHAFYTMELVEGGSLDRHIKRFSTDQRAAANLVVKVARAVHYAHQRRVLHRDLKPGNVLLDERGEPHVADFGLATKLNDEGEAKTGAMAGSLPWMAPEAVRGETTLTTAVDVWALGVILYEMVTGRRPFEGIDRGSLRKSILETEPAAPREVNAQVDRDLDAICRRCLEKDPERRYESASALAIDLERWLRGEPVRARKADRFERVVKWGRRNPSVASAVAFLVTLAVAGLLAAFSMARDQETRLNDEVCRSNEFAAHHVASTLLARLHEYGDAVEATSNDEQLQRACVIGDWASIETVLRARLLSGPAGRNAPPFATAFVLDPGGTIRAESPQNRTVVGENFATRDYFRGAQARASNRGGERVHFSRVFTSKNDGLDKLAVSVPFRPAGSQGPVWVLGATIPTDSTLGLGGLHDERRKAVLLAPRESAGASTEYVVLIHPAYKSREPSIPFPADSLRRTESGFAPINDYADPVADRHPEFRGRWLVGFAPVPDTELIVLVQQPYDEAVAPHWAFFRRFLEWLAAAGIAAAVLIGAAWFVRHRQKVQAN
jgi:serine/threonine-protein kinase